MMFEGFAVMRIVGFVFDAVPAIAAWLIRVNGIVTPVAAARHMVVAGRMLERRLITVMITVAVGSVGVVFAYTWLVSTSGHIPWC